MLSPLRKANVFKRNNLCWCREKNNHITCYVTWRRIVVQGLGYVTLGAGKVAEPEKITCIPFSSAD